jgi:hypothetical protein
MTPRMTCSRSTMRITLVIDRDIEIARRLSTRYQGTSSFGREDAFQACVEGFFKADCPNDEGLVVTVMRNEMRRQSVESAYLMRVPYSSWKKMDDTPGHVRDTGLSSEYLAEIEHPCLMVEEFSYATVEEDSVVRWVASQLTEKELFRLNRWLGGYKLQGRQFKEIKDILEKIRELMEGAGQDG